MLSNEDFKKIFDEVDQELERTHKGVSHDGIDFIISELEEVIKKFKRVRSAEMHVKNIELFSYYTNIIEKMLDNAAGMARYCKDNTEPYYESPEVRNGLPRNLLNIMMATRIQKRERRKEDDE